MGYEVSADRSKCLECGDRIDYGRHDKKFCCDTCKNRYNNRKARGSRVAKVKILSALEKNYSILSRLVKMKVTSLSVTELRYMGFNFDCVTSYQKIRRHDVFLCFDISFTIVSSRVMSIRRLSLNLSAFVDREDGELPEFRKLELFRGNFIEECGDEGVYDVRRPHGQPRRQRAGVDKHLAESLEENVGEG